MSFPDIVGALKAKMPKLRGRLLTNQSLKELTWFRVGGPAQAFLMPEDESDLAYFLGHCPTDTPVMVVGLHHFEQYNQIELAGILGYPALRESVITIDYRDGLVGIDRK